MYFYCVAYRLLQFIQLITVILKIEYMKFKQSANNNNYLHTYLSFLRMSAKH